MQLGARKTWSLAIATALVAIATAGPLFASTRWERYIVPTRSCDIPFTIDARSGLKQVFIYASTDKQQFTKVATVDPAKAKDIRYTANADGPHFFVVQYEYANKKLVPDQVTADVINLEIIVDTTKPKVVLE